MLMCQNIIKYVVGWLKLDDDGGEVWASFGRFAAVKVHIIKVKTFILAAILHQIILSVVCIYLSVQYGFLSLYIHNKSEATT